MARLKWLWGPIVALALLAPLPAFAQAISGVVTDTTGAVLPGVTVEAASPALIEKTRVVVTDGAGRYSIVDLRPGVYSVTFTLEGFSTVKREGITLTSDFTAPVSVQLAVGSVSEVITVSAVSPLVDTTSVSKTQTIDTEMLDSLPLGNRTIQDIILTNVPGAGSTMFGTTTYRGSGDTLTTVDGNRVSWLGGPGAGASSQSLSPSAYQEYTVTTGIDNLDMPSGGTRINVVPKDGGNQFSGSVFFLYSGDAWSADNVPDKYKVAPHNLTVPAAQALNVDFNPTVGGPILKDKLWFQNTAHFKKSKDHVSGWFGDSDPNPFVYTPDTSDSPLSEYLNAGGGTRLTWQATAKDKVSGFYDDEYSHWGHFFAQQGSSPDSATNNYNPRSRNVGVKWSRTHTSKLLFEAGMGAYRLDLFNDLRDPMRAWSVRNGSANVGYADPAIPGYADMEIVRQGSFGSTGIGSQPAGSFFTGNGSSGSSSRSVTANAAATYITGTHNLKVGMTFLHGNDRADNRDIADVVLAVSEASAGFPPFFPPTAAGIPVGITASLPTSRTNTVDGDWGFYAQDTWTVKQLTLKGGVRYDWLRTSYPDQTLRSSVWMAQEQNCANNADFCGKSVLDWKDFSPRVGATYDLFGNGKTAVRAGVARYVAGETLDLTGDNNPIAALVRTSTADWVDLDGNNNVYDAAGHLQWNEINGGSRQLDNVAFGTPQLTQQFDPDVLRGFGKRGYTWEYDLGVDQEIFSRLSASVTYYRRADYNIRTTQNRNLSAADYSNAFCVIAPSDPRLGAQAGEQICGLYNINQGSLNKPADNYVTFSDKLDPSGKGFQNINRGFNITLNSRLPRGAFITGGFDIRSLVTDTCGFANTPERLFCRVEGAYLLNTRLSGAYTLPYGVQVALTYQANPGPNTDVSWSVSDADVARSNAAGVPSQLNRPLSSQFAPFVAGTKSVRLSEPSQNYASYVHNIDARFSKIFNFGRYRVTGGLDLYNLLNSGAVTGIVTSYPQGDIFSGNKPFGAITSIPSPRQLRLNATFNF